MNYKNELISLFNIFNETDKLYDKLAAKVGINSNQLSILYYLETHEKVTQKNITEDMLIPKQTVNTILNNWIKQGYIFFENELSKKNKIILFTELGKKELGSKICYVMNQEAIILNKIGVEETNNLVLANLKYLNIMREVIKNE